MNRKGGFNRLVFHLFLLDRVSVWYADYSLHNSGLWTRSSRDAAESFGRSIVSKRIRICSRDFGLCSFVKQSNLHCTYTSFRACHYRAAALRLSFSSRYFLREAKLVRKCSKRCGSRAPGFPPRYRRAISTSESPLLGIERVK